MKSSTTQSMAFESEERIRLGRRTELFRGTVITLVEREVDGKIFRVVEHPGASCAVPVTPDGKIVLIRQFRPAIGEWIWEIPAGTLELDESPEECMAREVVEEIGWEAESLESLGSIVTSPRFQQSANAPVRRPPLPTRRHETRGHREDQRARSGLGRCAANDGATGNQGRQVACGPVPIREPVRSGLILCRRGAT